MTLIRNLAICLLFLSPLAMAHHGNASHFDVSKKVDIEGQVTRLAFTNPHIYVYFTVEDQNGEMQEWHCEGSSATQLRRAGWSKDSIKENQSIRVIGTPARREEHVCYANQIYVDGVEMNLNGDQPIIQEASASPEGSPTLERPLIHETGQPNISGYWVNPYFGRNRPTPYLPDGGYVRTEAGKTARDNFDDRYESPALFCKPHNIIRAWGQDAQVNEVRQTQDSVFITNGYMDFEREIHLNQTEHPDDIEPGTAGHSIGHWEADTLVVDTIGFTAGSIFPRNDVMHSAQMHTVERFRFNKDTQQLERRTSVEDPLYLAEVRYDIDYQVISNDPYEPFACNIPESKDTVKPE